MKRRRDIEAGQINLYMLDLAQCVLRQLRESENILSYCTMSGILSYVHL